MDIKDEQGKKIIEGTTLKYLGTRTKGKADKICFKDDHAWIRLDSTGLYYRKDYLIVITPQEAKKRAINRSNKEKILEKLNKPSKQTQNENYEISSQSDGPGVGGG